MLQKPEFIQANVDLSKRNSLAVPSTAEFFAQCNNVDELSVAITWARAANLSIRILGGGSNTLLEEQTQGLVLKVNILAKQFQSTDSGRWSVSCGAGENWHDFVNWCLLNNLFGLENLSLIPGSVGAAPIQNIGAYGVEAGSLISHVDVLDVRDLSLKTLSHKECEFSYRESVFKTQQGKHYIVLQVYFLLSRKFKPNISYAALEFELDRRGLSASRITAKELADVVCAVRIQKLPDPALIPNAGSFFKNPIISLAELEKIKLRFPNVVSFPYEDGFRKVAAAWLIDTQGWKSKKVNDVGMHSAQALVLVNPKCKPLKHILNFAQSIQLDIKNTFGIELEIEPQKLRELIF